MISKGVLYEQITELLASGRIAEGEKAIEVARNQLPPAVLLECTGNVHFYRHELQEAITKYEEAMTTGPDYDAARYHYLLGVQEERMGEYVKAFERYQAAIEVEPTFVDVYVELGGMLGKVGDNEGALRCYTDALKLEATDLRNFWNRMEVLRRLSTDDPNRYRDAYQRAVIAYEDARKRLPAIDESTNW
jgi:tetratricopeptide (TPR) repeat protein